MEQKNNVKSYPAADGIRGVAIAIVLLGHGCGFFIPQSIPYLAGTGKIGVWLFFVLSAFLLTNKFISTGFTQHALIRYIAGRTIRILPISLLAVITYFIAGYLPAQDLPGVLTMQSGYDHLWTIPVEYKFYFILPVIAYIALYLWKNFSLPIALVALSGLMTAILIYYPPSEITTNTIETGWYIPCFLFGIVISLLVDRFSHLNISAGSRSVTVLLLLSLLILMVPAFSNLLAGTVFIDNLPTRYVQIAAIWAAIIFLTVSGKSCANTLFSCLPLRLLGKYSFSVYLFHVLIMKSIAHISRDSYALFFISIMASCIAGGVIFHLIESPVEKFRHRILK